MPVLLDPGMAITNEDLLEMVNGAKKEDKYLCIIKGGGVSYSGTGYESHFYCETLENAFYNYQVYMQTYSQVEYICSLEDPFHCVIDDYSNDEIENMTGWETPADHRRIFSYKPMTRKRKKATK